MLLKNSFSNFGAARSIVFHKHIFFHLYIELKAETFTEF